LSLHDALPICRAEQELLDVEIGIAPLVLPLEADSVVSRGRLPTPVLRVNVCQNRNQVSCAAFFFCPTGHGDVSQHTRRSVATAGACHGAARSPSGHDAVLDSGLAMHASAARMSGARTSRATVPGAAPR